MKTITIAETLPIMAASPDYYEILQVPPTAEGEIIQAAYRRLSQKLHADVNPGDANAGERMKLLNEAYAVISDPQKRREYDLRRGHDTGIARASDPDGSAVQTTSSPAGEAEPTQVGAGIDFTDPNSPLAPFYLRASQVIAVAVLVGVYFFFGVATQLAHTDVWGHLKYGEWIFQHQALPQAELFSEFSDPDQPYWNFQWLTQLFFYACYHAGELLAGGDDLHRMAGGVEMLRALHGLLTMLKIAFLMLAIRRSTNSLPLATTGAILYVVLAHGYSRIERPQVVGEVLFALLLWTISGRQLAWWCVAGIPAFFVVWANCHGSFLVGFVLLGAMCAGQIVASIWAPRPIDRAKWWRNCWIRFGIPSLVLAPVAIGILNPHGWELYPGILELSRHPNIRTVAEWAPLDFSKPVGGHWLYLGTLALVTLSQAVSPRPLGLSRALVLLAFGIGPLHQQRMGIWWMLIFPWVLMDLWHGAAAVMPRFWRGFRSVPSFRKTLIAVLVVLMGASWSGAVQLLFGKDPRPLANAVTRSTLWPLAQHLRTGAGLPELGAALKKYPNQRFQGRIFAQDMLADYLVWALPEKAPIQIYNHAHVFPEAVWHDHITVLEGKKTCKSVLDRYQVNLIAIDPIVCTELAQVIRESGDWQIIKDEGQGEGQDRIPDVFNGKLFVALRKQPI